MDYNFIFPLSEGRNTSSFQVVHSRERRKKFKIYLLLTLEEVECQLKKNPENHIISLFSIKAPVLTQITAAKLQI